MNSNERKKPEGLKDRSGRTPTGEETQRGRGSTPREWETTGIATTVGVAALLPKKQHLKGYLVTISQVLLANLVNEIIYPSFKKDNLIIN
ncbi:hypothetical protein V1477_012976 [Vespula maculifrons]|uniref:Uncharacterized protein n=1 Tax=Vespula maculifrons TaxID=7453 RepID=A0ABD2BUL4_VESMC